MHYKHYKLATGLLTSAGFQNLGQHQASLSRCDSPLSFSPPNNIPSSSENRRVLVGYLKPSESSLEPKGGGTYQKIKLEELGCRIQQCSHQWLVGCFATSQPTIEAQLVLEEKCLRPAQAFPEIADHFKCGRRGKKSDNVTSSQSKYI